MIKKNMKLIKVPYMIVLWEHVDPHCGIGLKEVGCFSGGGYYSGEKKQEMGVKNFILDNLKHV